jgi:hypothetical protein
MRQKTKKYQNQESTDKKIKFLSQSLSYLPRWVYLVQKTRAKNSHAWAPLNMELDLQSLFGLHSTCTAHCLRPHNPPPPPQLGSNTRALLFMQDRQHLFVTP